MFLENHSLCRIPKLKKIIWLINYSYEAFIRRLFWHLKFFKFRSVTLVVENSSYGPKPKVLWGETKIFSICDFPNFQLCARFSLLLGTKVWKAPFSCNLTSAQILILRKFLSDPLILQPPNPNITEIQNTWNSSKTKRDRNKRIGKMSSSGLFT